MFFIHDRIELRRHGRFMEHCVVCAALAAWIQGTKLNWVGEVQTRIQEEEVEDHKLNRPMLLRSAWYIGVLCQFSFGRDITMATSRTIALLCVSHRDL